MFLVIELRVFVQVWVLNYGSDKVEIFIMIVQDKLLDQSSVSHLFPVTKYLGLLATGMTGLYKSIIMLVDYDDQVLIFLKSVPFQWNCS